jgi:hypothetical protein
VVFSFSSLAPLAAWSFNQSTAGMRCCKTKAKSCCHKPSGTNPDGPIAAPANCGDCDGTALGTVSGMSPAAIPLQALTLAIHAAGNVPAGMIAFRSRLSVHSLRQRPPPTNCPA